MPIGLAPKAQHLEGKYDPQVGCSQRMKGEYESVWTNLFRTSFRQDFAAVDGVNDAPTLAAADVGMAMGNRTDVAMQAAGITLMRGDPALVAAALDISDRTVSKIRQNLFWAFAYNVAGIPLAAFGFLNPVVAGAAMAMSSVSAMRNALPLRRWTPRHD